MARHDYANIRSKQAKNRRGIWHNNNAGATRIFARHMRVDCGGQYAIS